MSPETWIFAALCVVDLAWTVVAVRLGIARETNPLLRPLLATSVGLFVCAKTFSFAFPLTVLEIVRKQREKFVKIALRVGIGLYVLSYVGGSLFVNHLPVLSMLHHG